jgi:Thymidylate kinase
MFVAALIGPDGAGKTEVGHRLEQTLPLPVKYVYMGLNMVSSNPMLPSSRLIHRIRRALSRWTDPRGGEDPVCSRPYRRGTAKRVILQLRSDLRMANLLAEECLRHGLVWYHQRRGNIILFDRWVLADCYASEGFGPNSGQTLARRIHRFMLERVYPKPDLVIYLDAPADVLFARKGEGTLASLERQRQGYLRLREVIQPFAVVDATQPAHEVAHEVTVLILDFYKSMSVPPTPLVSGERRRD